jgi:cytochrome c553
VMQPISVALDGPQIAELARHFAALPRAPARAGQDAAAVERGRVLAERGVPQAKVPVCRQCHDRARDTNPLYPRLEGQWAEYLVLQLELFATGTRGGTEWAHLMDRAIHRLEPGQMRDVAAFYASE